MADSNNYGSTERRLLNSCFLLIAFLIGGSILPLHAMKGDGCVQLDLRKFTNMGFQDENEGDERGGWNDHGEGYDARNFPIFQKSFSNVPFKIINPAENSCTSIVVFRNKRKRDGVDSITLDVKPAAKAKYLNLLHATAWIQEKNTPIGTITVFSDTGKKAEYTVVYGKDTRDWFSWGEPKVEKNMIPACQIPSGGGNGYIYTSEFKIPDDFGKVTKVVIKSEDKDKIAYWMLVAATLTPEQRMKYVKPVKGEHYLVSENKEWRRFNFPVKNGIVKGSILDYASNIGESKKGAHILRPDGEYVLKSEPDQPLRFMLKTASGSFFWDHPSRSKQLESTWASGRRSCAEFIGQPYTNDSKKRVKASIDAHADRGYNALFFFGDGAEGLTFIEGKPGEMKLNMELIDLRNYMLKCAKDRGVKILMSQTAQDGYWQIPWTNKGDPTIPKGGLHVNDVFPERRERILKAMDLQFNQINSYTGTTIMKDPDVLSVLMRNECDKQRLTEREMQLFRAEMKNKYKTIDALKKAWNCQNAAWKTFEEIPNDSLTWQGEASPRSVDYFLYLLKHSKENLAWFKNVCRKFGYQGPVTSYDMTKSFYNSLAREDAGSVYMHVYHGHPMGNDIVQESPIGEENSYFRNMAATQFLDKPIFMTEQNVCYWNQFRYEQAFVANAYAALNGFDGMLNFTGIYDGANVLNPNEERINPFFGKLDPICHATEFLGIHIFRNNAVKKSPVRVRLRFSEEELLKDYGYRYAPSGLQTRLSLVFQFGLETPKTALPMTDKDVVLNRTGGAGVRNEKLFALIVEDKDDKSFDLNKFLNDMKKKGLLPKNNRTNPDKNIWESCTGELYMESNRKFGAIKTDRVQGICALGGTTYSALPDFKVNKMTKNGTLNVVAVDGKPIRESDRLVVVYATNALNQDIEFTDKSMRTCVKPGGPGVIYECGYIDVEIKNKNAGKLRAWSVSLDGTRGVELPVLVRNGRAWFRVDVAKLPGGPAIFFELAEK